MHYIHVQRKLITLYIVIHLAFKLRSSRTRTFINRIACSLFAVFLCLTSKIANLHFWLFVSSPVFYPSRLIVPLSRATSSFFSHTKKQQRHKFLRESVNLTHPLQVDLGTRRGLLFHLMQLFARANTVF